jgi:hypothetical protein
MSDFESKAIRVDSRVRVAQIYNKLDAEINLGDLRKLVAKAEGLDDESDVTFDGVEPDDYFAGVHIASGVIVREVIRESAS